MIVASYETGSASIGRYQTRSYMPVHNITLIVMESPSGLDALADEKAACASAPFHKCRL